ncbi:MAG: tetratricopeptide repeat protein [Planctomycetota bacterium]|jgi:tetratricopeptide (TPR) repeat protein
MKYGIIFVLCLSLSSIGCTTQKELSFEVLNAGQKAFLAGKHKEAIKHFEMAIEYQSHNWLAYAECGDAYFFLKDYESAVSYYDNAATILHSMIRQRLESAKRSSQSKALVLGDAERYQRMQSDVLHKRGIALIYMKKYSEAKTSFLACLRINKEHMHCWWSLAQLYDNNLKNSKQAYNAYKWLLYQYSIAPMKKKQDYEATNERIAYASKRKQELSLKLYNKKEKTEKKKPGVGKLICTTADEELRKEVEELITEEAQSAGLQVTIDNSGILVEGKRELLKPLQSAIIKNFPNRLDRIEMEIK